jgi:hypothetical protein
MPLYPFIVLEVENAFRVPTFSGRESNWFQALVLALPANASTITQPVYLNEIGKM